MKILYTEGKLYRAGQKLLVNAVSVNDEYLSTRQKEFRISFPDVDSIIHKVYEASGYAILSAPGDQQPPKLGDVLWVETSGGKMIANCVIYDANYHLNVEALVFCIKSVANKAAQLGQQVLAMDLLETDRNREATLGDWNTVVTYIEEILEDVQAIVYVPNKDDLIYIIEHLPGEKTFRKIYADPIIRFRSLSKEE